MSKLRDKLKKNSTGRKDYSIPEGLYERVDKIYLKCYKNKYCDCKECRNEEGKT